MVLPVKTSAKKHIKESLQITGTTHVLGMELHAEERQGFVHDALIALIIGIGEQHLPICGQVAVVHSKAMILCSDEAALGRRVEAWLVVTTIAISAGTGG